jgi:hypothetical protein
MQSTRYQFVDIPTVGVTKYQHGGLNSEIEVLSRSLTG